MVDEETALKGLIQGDQMMGDVTQIKIAISPAPEELFSVAAGKFDLELNKSDYFVGLCDIYRIVCSE